MRINPLVPCPVFVGRAHELSLLTELLEAARQGSGATVLVGGEAGIGKTRLCRELKRDATARGFRVIEGRCSTAEASVPYAPFVDALRFRMARGEGAVAARMMGPLLERVAPLLPQAPPPARARSAAPRTPIGGPFDAIYRVMQRLTTLDPVLLVLEDVQWADPTSCELLQFLSRRVSGDRMLIVATYRTDELPGRHPVRRLVATLARERVGTELLLRPFEVEEVGAQVAAILGTRPGADVSQAIWERTDGNPLFVEELLKSGGAAAADLRTTELPATISETILARVEALGARAFEVLSVAAVVGRRVSFDLLKEVTGIEEEELLGVVEQLVAHQLLVEGGAPGREAYAFRHLLTQEVLYGSVIARRRRLWHRRVAQALEASAADELPRQYDALAYHCRLGGDAARVRKYELLAGDQAAEL
ncbi:MAG: ATP-binding protein, partial [Myxococcota bacterium]